MVKEIEYASKTKKQHMKKLGQFFTHYTVADFMARWASEHAQSVLDPALGNSVFFKYVRKYNNDCNLTCFEIDEHILDFFGNPYNAHIIPADYLKEAWHLKYDAIVCNPPYNRFQSIHNRDEIIGIIEKETGMRYSTYTNQYILFLIKSIFQMSNNGKLAYIIPTEFLNSKYGIPLKKLMLEQKLINTIINFENDTELYANAITTNCVLLLDNSEKSCINFINLASIHALSDLPCDMSTKNKVSIPYENISPTEKWRQYLQHEKILHANSIATKTVADFCKVTRGIATGANDFFCLRPSDLKKHKIQKKHIRRCICKSGDVLHNVFTTDVFDALVSQNKKVFLLDADAEAQNDIDEYIQHGIKMGTDKKYLPSHRTPWYAMEQKPAAPIWMSSACRNRIKFVRNLAGVKALTTFHSIFMKDEHKDLTDIIFCYFLTPTAQTLIMDNRKQLGNGLIKFQPGDISTSKMLDLTVLSEKEKKEIHKHYERYCVDFDFQHVLHIDAFFIKKYKITQ